MRRYDDYYDKVPRYDDRYDHYDRYDRNDRYGGNTKLYVGRLSPRTRTEDIEDLFSRYGRVRYVDLKYDYGFVEFSDPRDADDARYNLDGRDFEGTRIIVEFAKGTPRGPGGSREYAGGGSRDYAGRGPPPGSGRCFNCGIEGHWARDCNAGDWKNKCYRCGEKGHIERDCRNSPKDLKRGRSISRSPPPRRGRSRSRSYNRSRSRSYSRPPAGRDEILGRSRSRSYSRSPRRSASPLKGRNRSPTPNGMDPAPRERADHVGSPRRGDSRSPARDAHSGPVANGRSPSPRADSGYVANGRSPSPRAGEWR